MAVALLGHVPRDARRLVHPELVCLDKLLADTWRMGLSPFLHAEPGIHLRQIG